MKIWFGLVTVSKVLRVYPESTILWVLNIWFLFKIFNCFKIKIIADFANQNINNVFDVTRKKFICPCNSSFIRSSILKKDKDGTKCRVLWKTQVLHKNNPVSFRGCEIVLFSHFDLTSIVLNLFSCHVIRNILLSLNAFWSHLFLAFLTQF